MDILKKTIKSKKEFVGSFCINKDDKSILKSEYKELKKHFTNHINKVLGNCYSSL